MSFGYEDISKMIDHALLVPNTSSSELETGIQLALSYNVASVCIMPHYLERCAELLRGSSVRASTTIGFPHGGHATSVKVKESELALAQGCQELDVVTNISRVLSGDWAYVRDEIAAIVELTHKAGQRAKVIFENCYLNDDQKVQLCQICAEVNADWVKTSTGYGTGGATLDDLKLMRTHSPESVQVKAAGGVRDFDSLLEVRDLGVSRVGSSRTKTILDECRQRLGLEPINCSDSGVAGY